MLIALGLVLAVRALRSAPPSLTAALEQLSAGPTAAGPGTTATTPPNSTGHRWTWLPPTVARRVEERLGVSDADLAILGRTRSELAARKLTLALAGLLTPALLSLVLVLLDVPVAFLVPGAVALGLAAVGWVLPSAAVREAA